MRHRGKATLALVRHRRQERLRSLGIETTRFAVIVIFPFSLLFGALLLVGMAWWVAAPAAYIFMPIFRSLLFGPPCGHCCRKLKKRELA